MFQEHGCKHKKHSKTQKKNISKDDEYNQPQELFARLRHIPNVSRYFIGRCDLKRKYTRKNIQRHDTQDLRVLNGGRDLEKIFEDIYSSSSQVLEINDLLIDLLVHAILPMNERNVFHGDIKSTNIVYDGTNVRLINWGLAMILDNDNDDDNVHAIPGRFLRSSFQYNAPIGIVLLSNEFASRYAAFLLEGQQTLFDFVIDYIYDWIREINNGAAHLIHFKRFFHYVIYDHLSPINEKHSMDKHFAELNLTINFMAHYLVEILKVYTDIDTHGHVTMVRYFNEKFLKDLDVCGFLTTYTSFILIKEKVPNAFNEDPYFWNQLKFILCKYLFTPMHGPISITDIVHDLQKLNKKNKRKRK